MLPSGMRRSAASVARGGAPRGAAGRADGSANPVAARRRRDHRRRRDIGDATAAAATRAYDVRGPVWAHATNCTFGFHIQQTLGGVF